LALLTLSACSAENTEDTSSIPSPIYNLTDSGEEVEEEEEEEENEEEDTDTDASENTSVSYSFSDKESLLYVQVFKDTTTLLQRFAHNHVIRASQWNGSLVYDIQDPSACELNFTVPVQNLIVDEDQMRELVGYEKPISSGDRTKIKGHMLDTNQLNGANFPDIEFSSTECSGTEGAKNGQLTVEGKFTILGVPVDVTIPVDYRVKDDNFYASGTFEMSMWDFGMAPYSAFGGGVKNQEGLFYTFNMVGAAN
jgi:polyisoprenoid-binding protein YceI